MHKKPTLWLILLAIVTIASLVVPATRISRQNDHLGVPSANQRSEVEQKSAGSISNRQQVNESTPPKVQLLRKLLMDSSLGKRGFTWSKFWSEFTKQSPDSALREFLDIEDEVDEILESGLCSKYELYCVKRNLITGLKDDTAIKALEQQMLQNREATKSQKWLGLIFGKRVMTLPPISVLSLFDSLPNIEERASAEALYLGELRHRDITAAASYFLKPGGAVPDEETASVIFTDWVRSDPEAASTTISGAVKSEKRDQAISAMIQAIWKTDPDSSQAWLQEISDPKLQKLLRLKFKL